MRLNSYNLNGYELDLDADVLKKYGELTGEEFGSKELNASLSWLGKMMTETDSFEEAVNKVGLEELAKLIMRAIKNELSDLFGEEI